MKGSGKYICDVNIQYRVFKQSVSTKTHMCSVDTNMDHSDAMVQSKHNGTANGEYRISDSHQKYREWAKNVVFKL